MAARRKLKTFTIAAVLLLAGCAHPHITLVPPPYSCDPAKVCVLRHDDCGSVALPMPPAGVDCSCRGCQPYGRDAAGQNVDGNGVVIP